MCLNSGRAVILATTTNDADCAGACSACPAVGSCAERIVCRCLKVTEETIISAIRVHGTTTIRELRTISGAGDGCTCCHRELKQYLAVYAGAKVAVAVPA
jgi:bacterioferritin-associated ferredoxin